jgi:methylthioribulose-1-phosphate dehydratase
MKEKLAQVIRELNLKGWSPATSTNYSFKDDEGIIWVSKSGIDKAYFSASDFMSIDENGLGLNEYKEVKPSAETLIHTAIYRLFPATKVILHSHSVYPVLLSAIADASLMFEGYEVQKGFKGQTTHETKVEIPVFDNTQDMTAFQSVLEMNVAKLIHHVFVMRKHGTYAWGENLFEAKRHLETLDYLCECDYKLKSILN